VYSIVKIVKPHRKRIVITKMLTLEKKILDIKKLTLTDGPFYDV